MTRLRIAALLIACVAIPGTAFGQAAAAPARHTGDAWVDARLADIDAYAATYRDAFVDEMTRYHRAPRELVQELLARPGWTPGDVYYACSLAQQAGQPCRSVADRRAKDPAPAWDTVSGDVGVVPGSPGFHALKRDIVATYDRWARPIRVDAELAPDFPRRPVEAPSAGKSGPGVKSAADVPASHRR
ncbi:hypothetical protein [Lysobacter claricitrinus]|uniref:hypothetical protein n=1 Tax=Lysobacter claricitrinus TaxID=3367728 RepID=UPI0037DAD88C